MILWLLVVVSLTAFVSCAPKCEDDVRLKNIEVSTKEDTIADLDYTVSKIGRGRFKIEFTVTIKKEIPGTSKAVGTLKANMIPSIPLVYGMKLDKVMKHDVMKIATECSNFKAVVPVEKGKYKGDCTINVAFGIPFVPKEGTGTIILTSNNVPLITCKAKVEKFKSCT